MPIPVDIMNRLYNTGDMFLTTHLGEGWGLSITEALAAGTPVVSPNNTCMPQQLGKNSERGYMYECKDEIWIDESGFRPKGLINDIVEQMMAAYKDKEDGKTEKISLARKWAEEHDWSLITKKWVDLFSNIETLKERKGSVIEEI